MEMTAQKFLDGTLRPVLAHMEMGSPSAEKLLLMTACHESGGFRYKQQVGGGPALSYYQIEPRTLHDLIGNYLAYRSDKKTMLDHFWPVDAYSLEDALMNDRYATAAARLIYSRVSEQLPSADDDQGMAEYWKTYWNTCAGAGTVDKFLDDWARYKPEDYA